MLITSLAHIEGSKAEATGPGWISRRLIVEHHGRPFSFHQTTVQSGTSLKFCYQRQSETVFCLKGRATLTNLNENRSYQIEPGSLYSVTVGEPHMIEIQEEADFICVFDPPLKGREEAL